MALVGPNTKFGTPSVPYPAFLKNLGEGIMHSILRNQESLGETDMFYVSIWVGFHGFKYKKMHQATHLRSLHAVLHVYLNSES